MAKLRILVADDEEGIRESLRLILGKEYDVVFAEDGQQAATMIARNHLDLVLLDIKMPKVDGLEIMKRLAKQRRQLPVVVLTAYQSVELAKEAVKLGAVDYLPKPFDRESLLAAIHDALAKK